MSIYDIADEKKYQEILHSRFDIIVLYIYGDWCNPCKVLYPKLEALAGRYANNKRLLFCKLNSEKRIRTDLKGLPTIEFHVSNNGQRVLYHTVLGADYPNIEKTLQSLLSQDEIVMPQPKAVTQGSQAVQSKTGKKQGQYKSYGNYN